MKKLPFRKNIRLKHYDYKQDGYYFVTVVTGLPSCNNNVAVRLPSHNVATVIKANSNSPVIKANSNSPVIKANSNSPATIWQWNYFEHIIRNEKALSKIREYIQNNPDALKIRFEEFYKDRETGLINLFLTGDKVD